MYDIINLGWSDDMFNKKRMSNELDYEKLNELIKVGRNFLKLIFGVSIVALVVLITYIGKEWKIMRILGDILTILSPFFIGVIIAWLFDPIVTFFQKKGVKRGIGVTFVYVLLIAIFVLIGNLLMPSLIKQINEIIAAAPQTIKSFGDQLESLISNLAHTYNADVDVLRENVYEVINNLLNSITVDLPSTIISLVKSVLSGGLNIVMGLLIGFYMLLDFDDVRKHLSKLIPAKYRDETDGVIDELNGTLRRYVYGTLIVMFVLFICQSIGMAIAGMKAPLVFGLFCAVTNIIPYLGPYIGGIPSVAIAFTISPRVGIGVLISVLICQLLESYLLTPTIMSKTMKLHPVTIIIGLLLFGHFFGILGMLFATPIISCGKVIINFFIKKYSLFDE